MWGLAVCSNTSACEESASKAWSKAYSFEEPCWLRRYRPAMPALEMTTICSCLCLWL
jgi:hypothetical protein